MCMYSSLSDIFFPPNQLNCKTTSGEVFWSCSNSQIMDSYGSFHRFDPTASVNLDFDFGRYVVSNRLSLLRPQSIPQFIIHDEMTWWVTWRTIRISVRVTSVFLVSAPRFQYGRHFHLLNVIYS